MESLRNSHRPLRGASATAASTSTLCMRLSKFVVPLEYPNVQKMRQEFSNVKEEPTDPSIRFLELPCATSTRKDSSQVQDLAGNHRARRRL